MSGSGLFGDDARPRSAPLFPVATHKFVVLSLCTLGLYELYWSYQNWRRIEEASPEGLSPFWRAVFAPIWSFSLFRRVRDLAEADGLVVRWNPIVLAVFYLLLGVSWRLPDPWSWVGFATVLALFPVQQTAQLLNRRYLAPDESPNNRYGVLNIATIIVGGTFLLLATIGSFLPPE